MKRISDLLEEARMQVLLDGSRHYFAHQLLSIPHLEHYSRDERRVLAVLIGNGGKIPQDDNYFIWRVNILMKYEPEYINDLGEINEKDK